MNWHWIELIGSLVLLGLCATAATPQNLAATARVTVDSTFRGYGADVLTDGLWVELGHETTQDTGSPDRLGNCGNTWVSEAEPGVEHWVRLDWEQPVECNRAAVWLPHPEWYPHAFRVEYLSDTN